MKSFLLLRNNVETGPYTLEELTAQALKSTDLVWIEGQNTSWNYPAEIEILKPHVTAPEVTSKENVGTSPILATSKTIFVALPPQAQKYSGIKKEQEPDEPVELELRFAQSLESLKENYKASAQQASFQFRKTFSKPHSAIWLVCVFAGLLLSAGIIKKMVEAYDENNAGLATAAAMPVHDRDRVKEEPEEDLYQNALTTEVVPVDTLTMKPVKKGPVKINLKKLVQLEANDYQVGLFGGIKNLRLLVTNKSAFVLDKVKIELNYLKPNGEVIKTQNLTLKDVAPKSSKSIKVASQNRGVKIAYRITNILSRQNAENMVTL